MTNGEPSLAIARTAIKLRHILPQAVTDQPNARRRGRPSGPRRVILALRRTPKWRPWILSEPSGQFTRSWPGLVFEQVSSIPEITDHYPEPSTPNLQPLFWGHYKETFW